MTDIDQAIEDIRYWKEQYQMEEACCDSESPSASFFRRHMASSDQVEQSLNEIKSRGLREREEILDVLFARQDSPAVLDFFLKRSRMARVQEGRQRGDGELVSAILADMTYWRQYYERMERDVVELREREFYTRAALRLAHIEAVLSGLVAQGCHTRGDALSLSLICDDRAVWESILKMSRRGRLLA